jgi:hypothetical protein
MTWKSLASAALLLDYTLGANAAAAICSTFPYKDFQILAAYQPALSFCSSKYPLPVPTCTAYETKTNTLTVSTTVSVPSSTTTITSTVGTPATTTTTITM